MFYLRFIVTFGVLSRLVSALPHQNLDDLCAETTSGRIVGHQAAARPNVREWLGIKYAKAARFMPPEPYRSNNTYIASNYSDECPCQKGTNGELPGQPYTKSEHYIMGYFLEEFNVTMSDDCLALNIWSKKTDSPSLKPVLLWAYGGHWATGITNTPEYRGEYLADQEDIVVVTINYRFSIFGFGKDNVGIQDGRMAMEWVRDNIEAFGGDPLQITMAGHSAGADLVDTIGFAYPEDPIAAGYILQSGSVTTLPNTNPALRDEGFMNVSKALGCSDTKDEVACLQEKDLHEVAAAANEQHTTVPHSIKAVFGPTVDHKLVFSPSEIDARGKAGNFPQVPAMIGNADYEQGFYKLQLSGEGVFMNESSWALLTQRLATCPSSQGANWRESRVPTYRYRYFGEYPSTKLYGPNANGSSYGSGAYHGSELSLVWGTSEILTLEKNSAELTAMSQYLMKTWGSFIRDPNNGLKPFGWPQYNSSGSTLIRLGEPGQKLATFGNSTEFDFVGGTTCKEVMRFET